MILEREGYSLTYGVKAKKVIEFFHPIKSFSFLICNVTPLLKV